MSTFRKGIALAALPVIVSACALDGADREPTEATSELEIQAAATAQLEAQAASGNRDAQEVLRGMERFRQQQATGQAVVGTLCDTQWRTIIHGESSVTIKVGGDNFATALPLQPWEGGRELFLFCRDDRWTLNYHLIWSNVGNYLTTRPGQIRITCIRLRTATDLPIAEPELFDIQNLDGTWSYFHTVANNYLRPGVGERLIEGSSLDGATLFRCTPGRCTTRFGR